MKKLTKLEFVSISVMLFGMFFGAGNLIFPPSLGYFSGDKTYISFIFFSISAIIFPILAIIAVAKSNGMQNLASRVNPKFAIIYSILIYISIGPGLALPRSAAVPFEMAIFQYLPEGINVNISRLIFTFLFFTISYLISLSPGKIVDRSGKILTPLLIILVFLLFIGLLFNNPNQISSVKEPYIKSPALTGFIEGYNTLDAIAGLNFGFVIINILKSYEVKEKNNLVRYIRRSGIIAGSILAVIYFALSFIGLNVSGVESNFTNGAQVLTYISKHTYGNIGAAIVILLFTLACLTTTIGLIISISDYFASISKISARRWTLIITIVSFILSNFGLDMILSITVPVLNILYPFSLTLIIMGLTQDKFNFNKKTYLIACITTFTIAIITTLNSIGFDIPIITEIFMKLPLSKYNMSWIIPTLIFIIIAMFVTKNENDI